MHINSVNVASIIFFIYTDYKNIFFKVEIKYLSVYEKHNYVIDINNKNSLYKALYNLLNKEL